MSFDVAEFRALCGAKNFAAERAPGRKQFRLIDLEKGHAIMHPDRRQPTSSLKGAVIYLRRLDRTE